MSTLAILRQVSLEKDRLDKLGIVSVTTENDSVQMKMKDATAKVTYDIANGTYDLMIVPNVFGNPRRVRGLYYDMVFPKLDEVVNG